MAYFAATFVIFALVIAGMSIGYIVQKKLSQVAVVVLVV